MATTGPKYSRQRTFPGHSGAARKALRCRFELGDHHQAVTVLGSSAAHPYRHPRDSVELDRGTDPEHDGAARTDEWKRPLDCDRRRRKGLRDRDAETVGLLLLRPSPDHIEVGETLLPALQELRLPPLRLEQRHLPAGECDGQRNARRASTRTDIDDRALELADDLDAAQAVLQQDTPCFV